MDSVIIDLCLSKFSWAPFCYTKSAIKIHTLLVLLGSIPAFMYVTDGKVHDSNGMDVPPAEPAAIYVVDRGGDVEFSRLLARQAIRRSGFFVKRGNCSARCCRSHSAPAAPNMLTYSGQCISRAVSEWVNSKIDAAHKVARNPWNRNRFKIVVGFHYRCLNLYPSPHTEPHIFGWTTIDEDRERSRMRRSTGAATT